MENTMTIKIVKRAIMNVIGRAGGCCASSCS
jgi:Mb-OB3b family methanobactin precursor